MATVTDVPAPVQEAPASSPKVFSLTFSKAGLVVAAFFFALSLFPSLLPRAGYVQGIASGITMAIGYLIGVVPVLGTTRAVLRTSTGVFEMFTFPVTDPEVNFEAVLEPAYIF